MPDFRIRNCLRQTRGAALGEYSLLVGLIAVGAIAAISGLGREIHSSFTSSATALQIEQESDTEGNTTISTPDAQPEPPAPPFEVLASFTMTPGSDGSYTGYYIGGYGSLVMHSTSIGKVVALDYGSGEGAIWFDTSGPDDVTGMDLICNDTLYKMPDEDLGRHPSYKDFTSSHPDVPQYQLGQSYDCEIRRDI